jgi:hypothetical protein
VARTGLRMMPTFPRSPLTFRKASFSAKPLLDRRRGERVRLAAAKPFDVGRDVHPAARRRSTPLRRSRTRLEIPRRRARRRAACGDCGFGGEEFDETHAGMFAGGGNEDRGLSGVKGDELVHRLRPRHHRPTRRHAASRAMLPQSLGWSVRTSPVRTSPAFWVAFDSCTASMTGVALDSCTASTTGSASAISSSSVLIAFRSRAIDRSLLSEKCWRAS